MAKNYIKMSKNCPGNTGIAQYYPGTLGGFGDPGISKFGNGHPGEGGGGRGGAGEKGAGEGGGAGGAGEGREEG